MEFGREIIIFGGGGSLTPDIEESCARHGLVVAAVVLNRPGDAYSLDPASVIEVAALTPELRHLPFLCPLFTPANRRIAVLEALALGLRPALAVVDSTAIVAGSSRLGEGVFIGAGAILGALVTLGRHVLVNRGASIGHHSEAADFASIGPGAVIAGQVRIGAGAMVGAGAVVCPGVTLGENSVVAAGAVLRRDLPAGMLAAGNPARFTRRRERP
jgi:sugar O-acyltransferase (sialic acid O-acetyltransferase NeuD family)